jgi:hypothetical protein
VRRDGQTDLRRAEQQNAHCSHSDPGGMISANGHPSLPQRALHMPVLVNVILFE